MSGASSYATKNSITRDDASVMTRPDGHVRVVARIRPMNQDEARRGCRPSIYPKLEDDDGEEEQESSPGNRENFDTNQKETPVGGFRMLSRLFQSQQNDAAALKSPEILDEGIVLGNQSTPAPLDGNTDKALSKRNSLSPQPASASGQRSSKIPSPMPSTTSTATPPPPNNRAIPRCLIAESNPIGGSANQPKKKREFEFDAVLSPTATQEHVYEVTVGQSVRQNVLQGYNTTLLAYGQTGSGKTYTMGGQSDARKLSGDISLSPMKPVNSDEAAIRDDDGITSRAIHELFQAKHELAASGNNKVTIRLSCMVR